MRRDVRRRVPTHSPGDPSSLLSDPKWTEIPNVPRAGQIDAVGLALLAIRTLDPLPDLINTAVEVDEMRTFRVYALPRPDEPAR